MPESYSVKYILQVLKSKGFFFVSQSGSHAKYRKKGQKTWTVIIPVHNKDLPFGTFKSILRQSGLSREDFQKKGKKKR